MDPRPGPPYRHTKDTDMGGSLAAADGEVLAYSQKLEVYESPETTTVLCYATEQGSATFGGKTVTGPIAEVHKKLVDYVTTNADRLGPDIVACFAPAIA